MANPKLRQNEAGGALCAEATNRTGRADAPIHASRPPLPDIPKSALQLRELLSVVLLVVLSDVTIYRGHGFGGYALLLVAAPLLLLSGSPRPTTGWRLGIVGSMLLALAARMSWLGSWPAVVVGGVLLVAYAMSLAGRTPYLLGLLVYVLQTPVAGVNGLLHYGRSLKHIKLKFGYLFSLSVGLPLAAVGVFGTLFILANPDLVTSVTVSAQRVFQFLDDWILVFAPQESEVVFWGIVAWLTIGLLRPIVLQPDVASVSSRGGDVPEAQAATGATPLHGALRNMLVALIGLFAIYLAFEFNTLWFREFPKGFYYAGYAHEGAAWLTVALALATVVLSLTFRGAVLCDPHLPGLRRLAWFWWAENLILAVTVYNRLSIYISFNGMTRMRTVAIFGISAVVAGLFLTAWKIAHNRDFAWLVRRDLWALAIAVYLFVLTPVDMLVHAYNVRRILAGDVAPSVQISEHPVSAEGVLVLPSLAHCDDAIIREGIRALLADWAGQMQVQGALREEQGWTMFQCAEVELLHALQARRDDWQAYEDPTKRTAAWAKFREYAYQWY